MTSWQPSRRLMAVQDPVMSVVGAWIAETPGAISLGQGVVSWGPPREATLAAAAFASGSDPERHRYGRGEGEADLLQAVARKLQAENGIRVAPDSGVFVTAGGNMAFLDSILVVCDVGDEVILLAPFYFNHEMAVVMAGVRPVIVPTDESYQVDPDRIEASITPRTRAVVTISPNNPSGAVYEEARLRAVNAVCARHGVFHIHDEVYEYFTYDGHRHFSPGSLPGASAHTISLFSLSKAYGFASWRIGYMVVPRSICDAIGKVQDTNLICPPLISQRAALAALGVGRRYCDERIQRLEQVRRSARDALSTRSDLYDVGPADGALYLILRARSALTPLALVERLVREHRVAAVPGDPFGLSGCALRVSYGALEPETVTEGVSRLASGLAAILGP